MATRLSGASRRTLSSLAARVAGEGSLHRVRVAGVPEHFNAPFHTATAKGSFAAAGLLVEWTDFPGGTGAMTKALRDGSVDVALALTEGLVADLHQGNPSKLVGTYVASPLTWGVHVSATSALQTMADLDHATYAVSRLGSGSHLMAVVDRHARGLRPPSMEIVGSLDGARKALRDGLADAFMWEKFTTKFLVDANEWRRVGEVPTPWPCFSIAATDEALEQRGRHILTMLEVVRAEARALRASADCASTIGLMYAQQPEDIVDWLGGVRWCSRPVVSFASLQQVMGSLADTGVLRHDQLLPPSELVSRLCADGDPSADAV